MVSLDIYFIRHVVASLASAGSVFVCEKEREGGREGRGDRMGEWGERADEKGGRLFLLCLGDTPSGRVSYAAAILLWLDRKSAV